MRLAVETGSSIRSTANKSLINRLKLNRYITKKNNPSTSTEYANCNTSNMIFTCRYSCTHPRFSKLLSGLSKDKCRKLAYELAAKNDEQVFQNWFNEQKAG